MNLPPLVLNGFALCHALIAYGLGVGLLTVRWWELNLAGVLLLIHEVEIIHSNKTVVFR